MRVYERRFFQVVTITIGVIFFSSLGVYHFEHHIVNSNIHSIWDGIWWAIVTMGTVGYGDKYPISAGGRIVGMMLIFSGVGLMSLFTATIASMFVEKKIKEGKGLETVKEKDHIIICGWNEHTQEVIHGLTKFGSIKDMPIVLINELSVDDTDSLKLKYSKHNLKFLRGNYVHEDVLLRANISKAKFALIMADTSGDHPRDRIDERTTLAVLAIKSIAPQIKTIAELLENENKSHLKRGNVDEIIIRGEHVASLLASAINSPGLPKVFSNMLSLEDTNKLWRADIPRLFVGKTFKELSNFYRERQGILIGLLKEKKTMKLEDLLTDSTSAIDNFIREKLKSAKKDFYYEKEDETIVINPPDEYIVTNDDFAIVLAKSRPKNES
jgi:voltage-gated potassium channel